MPSCAVFGCCRTSGLHFLEDDGCTPLNFFGVKGVPRHTLRTWLKLCKRNELTLENCKNIRICSRHFLPSDIRGNRVTNARLKCGAIPSRNLPISRFAASFRETSQAQLLVSRVKINNQHEDKLEGVAVNVPPVNVITRPVCVHPVIKVTSLEPPWCFKTVDEITWYFLVIVSDIGIPEIAKSVKMSNDGSRPYFYIGNIMLSEHKRRALVRYKNLNIEDQFVQMMEEFCKMHAELNVLQSVLNLLGSVLGDSTRELASEVQNVGLQECDENEESSENANVIQDVYQEESFVCDNDENAAIVQVISHEESVTCDDYAEIITNKETPMCDVKSESSVAVRDVGLQVSDGLKMDGKVGLRFVMEQLQIYSVPSRSRRWSTDLIKWAMAMYLNSPVAYKYLRTSGYLLLPCERTLSRYTEYGVLKTGQEAIGLRKKMAVLSSVK